jgi:hypothetical protein
MIVENSRAIDNIDGIKMLILAISLSERGMVVMIIKKKQKGCSILL